MSWTLIYLLAFAFSLALTAYIIPKILVISFKKKLFDVVDARKVHTGYVPRLGGVSFTPTIIITSCLLVGLNIIFGAKHSMAFAYWAPEATLYLCSLIFLYLEGITDDLVGVGYKKKFALMFFVALMVVLSGTYISDFQGVLGLHRLPAVVGGLLTMVLVVFVINAINLIDGVDGLASGLSMLAFFFFVILVSFLFFFLYFIIECFRCLICWCSNHHCSTHEAMPNSEVG